MKSSAKCSSTTIRTGSTVWPSFSSAVAVSVTAARVAASVVMPVGESSNRPMRRRRCDGPSTRPSGGSFGLRQYCSAAAKNAAVSRTDRLRIPSLTRLMGRVRPSSLATSLPRVALRPTSPQQAAGMRMEPPPSLACAIGTAPHGHERGAAARRAACGVPRVPGVAHRWRVLVLGRGVETELRQPGLAEHRHAGAQELPGERRVPPRGPRHVRGAAETRGQTAVVDVVLDEGRHPREGPRPARGGGHGLLVRRYLYAVQIPADLPHPLHGDRATSAGSASPSRISRARLTASCSPSTSSPKAWTTVALRGSLTQASAVVGTQSTLCRAGVGHNESPASWPMATAAGTQQRHRNRHRSTVHRLG